MFASIDGNEAQQNKFAQLDEEQAGSQEPQRVTEKQNEDALMDEMQNDPFFLKRANQQNEASLINMELSQEIYAILNEMDGTFNSTNNGDKYLDWDADVAVPYRILRRLGETEPARLIKNKRRLDLARYARIPKEDGVERGFRLKYSNINYKPTKGEKIQLREWEQRIVKQFFFPPNEHYPNFSKFLGSSYEDFFDYDDMTWEIRRNYLNNPIGIHIGDPRIFKPVIPERGKVRTATFNDMKQDIFIGKEDEFIKDILAFDNNEDKDKPAYLLMHDNRRILAVNRKLVRKHHFFTRSDYRKAGRGYSIAEQGLNIATYIINSLKMNSSNFTNNRLPKGILSIPGVGTLQLEKLKKLMFAHMNGNNPNRLPIVSPQNKEAGEPKWIGVGGSSRDMEYHIWMTLLFSIWCQLSGTDPRELSLGTHADAVGKKSLFEENSDGVIKESRDAGAITFLLHIQDSLNVPDETTGKNLFQELTGLDIDCEFFGFEMVDKEQKQKTLKMKLETDLSINEILAQNDKEPQTLEVAGINIYDLPAINNAAVTQALQMKNQEAQQQAMMEQQNAAQTQTPDNELTPDDKALMEKYGNSEDVEIEKGLEDKANNQNLNNEDQGQNNGR
jgi:hypothetical protein